MDSEEAEKINIMLEDRLPKGDADNDYLQNVFNSVYGVAGVVAVVIIVFGGIQYITSQGESGKVAKAKNTIMYAVIGLIIIILAAAITSFVISVVMGAES